MAKSTKIIAALGVAGMLGTIALPTFADTETKKVVDNVEVTVEESCNFINETARTHAATQDDVDGGKAENVGDTIIDSYGKDISGSAFPGAVVDLNGVDAGEDAKHAFSVRCNTNKGYAVTAKATGLTHKADNSKEIPYQATGTYDKAGKTSNRGAWNVKISTTVDGAVAQSVYDGYNETEKANVDYIYNDAISTSNTTIITKKSATGNAGTAFEATYSAYVGVDTPTGTYEGTVEYTLTPAA